MVLVKSLLLLEEIKWYVEVNGGCQFAYLLMNPGMRRTNIIDADCSELKTGF